MRFSQPICSLRRFFKIFCTRAAGPAVSLRNTILLRILGGKKKQVPSVRICMLDLYFSSHPTLNPHRPPEMGTSQGLINLSCSRREDVISKTNCLAELICQCRPDAGALIVMIHSAKPKCEAYSEGKMGPSLETTNSSRGTRGIGSVAKEENNAKANTTGTGREVGRPKRELSRRRMFVEMWREKESVASCITSMNPAVVWVTTSFLPPHCEMKRNPQIYITGGRGRYGLCPFGTSHHPQRAFTQPFFRPAQRCHAPSSITYGT